MKKLSLSVIAIAVAVSLFAQNCNMTLKTTIEGFKVYKHNSYGTIMFKAKMAIDADGSPRAYGPNNSGLDYTANAGHSGNWWGVVTNNNGNPVIQGSSAPYPGMYVSTTSLVNNAYGTQNPLRYVNSEAIPFYVLPSAVTQLASIHLGDIGYVFNTVTGQGCYAIFADGGPSGKLGEGSIYLANQIGVNPNARSGGTDLGIIDYIVFPGSGSGQGVHKTVSEINTIGAAQMAAIGGTSIVNCLSPNSSSCGTPTGLLISAISSTAATLSWSSIAGANSYNVQYKAVSASTWTTTSASTNTKIINGLNAATAYQFKVQAVCSSTGSYSSSASFTTASTSTNTNSVITVGSGTSSYSSHPFGTVYMDERTQYIISKPELVAAGWSSGTPFLKSLAINVATAASQAMQNFSISISQVSNTTFSSNTFLSGTNSTNVFAGTITATSGWNTINFTTPFNYDGTSNLLISICWNNSNFTANSSVVSFSYSNYVALYYRADVANGGVCGQNTGTLSYYRPNMQLAFSSALNISTDNNIQERSLLLDENVSNSDFATELNIFPNPLESTVLNGKLITSNNALARNETNEPILIKIYDIMGREVVSQSVIVSEGQFNITFENRLQPGVYVLMGLLNENRFSKTLVVK